MRAINATSVASFDGPVSIFVGFSTAKDSSGNDLVTSYTQSMQSPGEIVLQHHVAYWIVGAPPAAGLPQVRFVTEN